MTDSRHQFVLFVHLLIFSVPGWCVTPQLESDTDISTAGYYRLQWAATKSDDFILEESQHDTFIPARKVYQGPDTARIISGRADGEYYYRVRTVNSHGAESVWSDVVHVEVRHHSLSRAFLFFSIGAFVFVVTLVVIIVGNLRVTVK